MRKFWFLGMVLLSLTACKKENKLFNGYIDADLVYLSSDFGGRLTELAVRRGQLVSKDQRLFQLEKTSDRYHVSMSEFNTKSLLAERAQIVSQLSYHETNYHRILGMRKENAASQSALDAALRDLNVSKQQLVDFDAKIKGSEIDTADQKWRMARKEGFAVKRGIIFDTYYTQGEFVQAGSPVLSLVTKENIKAVFFVAEAQLSQIRLNQKITIKTDNNENFAVGHICYIANIAEFTPPIIYSREERQRLVFRVEANIDTPDLEKVHLGLPVTLELA